jgi:hypothetical protein
VTDAASTDTGVGLSFTAGLGAVLERMPPRSPYGREDLSGDRPLVATVLDDWSAAAMTHEPGNVAIGPRDVALVLEHLTPAVLLVESAWRGNDGDWAGQLAGPRAPGPQLRSLLDACRERGIPTAFWHTEDARQVDDFLPAARLFDVVLAADAAAAERFEGLDVHLLPFAAQPALHAPRRVDGWRSEDVALVGRYYRRNSPRRKKQLDALLAAGSPHGLTVFAEALGGEPRYQFPDGLDVRPVLPPARMAQAYQRFKVALTISERRAVELAATKTPVLDGSVADPAAELSPLLASAELREQVGHEAWRSVARSGLLRHRVDRVLELCGVSAGTAEPELEVVLVAGTSASARRLLAELAAQTVQPASVRVVAPRGTEAGGHVLTPPEELDRAGWSPDRRRIVMSEALTYGPHHLEDLLLAMPFTRSPVLTKGHGDTFDMDTDRVLAGGWLAAPRVDVRPLIAAALRDGLGFVDTPAYATDRLGWGPVA